ncbi:MAG: glycogen/starch/alpha-glucan phosphorylase [Pseudomonadota bacterium]
MEKQMHSVQLSLMSDQQFRQTICDYILSFQARDPEMAASSDLFRAIAYIVREQMIRKWISSQKNSYKEKKKRVYYLSLEFLIGRSLGNSLINLGLFDKIQPVLQQMGYDLDEIREEEEDAALGNGGLGRLAACFMDSMASLNIPAFGYGINYDYGLFYQQIIDGFQVETPDNWLRFGSPWEIERTQPLYPVNFYGKVSSYTDTDGTLVSSWIDTQTVLAIPCDVLVPGYQNDNVINMRLWRAKASRELDLSFFNRGDYIGAVESKVASETITKLLYPSNTAAEGQELRFKQQYFFVAATLMDILRRFTKKNTNFDCMPDEVAIQLNDTHPAIAIPEMMRLLMDIYRIGWDQAFDICCNTFAYTNHTLLPEALETWPVDLIGRVLPRHLEIIYEINSRFLAQVEASYPGDKDRIKQMSIIDESQPKKVRMAHLAFVCCHSVNGVAQLHTDLLKKDLFKDFNDFYPGRINNKTNGITQRRWLLKCNPSLSKLISNTIGKGWIIDLDQLKDLIPHAKNPEFLDQFLQAKTNNKKQLASIIKQTCNIDVDPNSLFDVQVKRIHEYKRQLLNVLHIIHLYNTILSDPGEQITPRTFIFAGKAAPDYSKAKLIIKLIHSIADVINTDKRIDGRIKVVFIPNYSVSLAERIIPAADLSEQISTAGTEASGTGNMKFALNGSLTMGTMDGANIEILEEVGSDNIFIFGMDAKQVQVIKTGQHRTPLDVYNGSQDIKNVIDLIKNGYFSEGEKFFFHSLINDLLDIQSDPYLHLLDFHSYIDCQKKAGLLFKNQHLWQEKAVLNVANMGKFSSDRTIKEYAKDIWNIPIKS